MANETDYQQDPRDPFGFAARAGVNLFKFSYSWSALEMMRDAPTKGYYIPWTRIKAKDESRIAKFGMKMKWWGEGGLGNMQVNPEAVSLYRSRALGGLRNKSAQKYVINQLAPKLGMSVAKYAAIGAAASVLTGNVAGAALSVGAFMLSVGLGVDISSGLYGAVSNQVSKYRGLELGGYFPETQAGYTSRQRNLHAITASQLQARSAIGNEAMLFHR